jgi:hypothetical protein
MQTYQSRYGCSVNDYLQPLNAVTCRDHVPILGARYEKTNLQVPSGAPLHIWCERRRHCCEGAAEWNKDAGVSSAALSSHGHYYAGPPASHFILLFSAKHAALSSYRNGAHEIPGNDRLDSMRCFPFLCPAPKTFSVITTASYQGELATGQQACPRVHGE